MKILIIQLARLGDIYQTWPIIRALHREALSRQETVEIDFLTRDRFAEAALGLNEVRHVFKINSKEILAPVICDDPKVQGSIDRLTTFIEEIRAQNYDRIINLSFSSFSSYLTEAVATENAKVSGYSRYRDGFLNLSDDVSSYFLAQVGVGLFNRIHITDLFAQVAGVELQTEDWTLGARRSAKNQIAVHIGASRMNKTLAPDQWKSLIAFLLEKGTFDIHLIGYKDEMDLADQISFQNSRVKNLVGKTTLESVMQIVSESKLLVGGDSAPTHIAALTGTPVFNLSFKSVNFWETGPKSAGSRIFCIRHHNEISVSELAREILALLNSESSKLILVKSATEPYDIPNELKNSVGWELVQAIYMGKDFPPTSESIFKQALMRIFEVNQLALEQIAHIIKNPRNTAAAAMLEHCDLIMKGIENLSPEAGVLIRWLRTEKLRIGPDSASEVLTNFQNLHLFLDRILKVYPLDHWYQLKNGVLNDKNILDEA